MKQQDQRWVWLTTAALDARDGLRSKIIPGLDRAMEMEGDDLREHLTKLRDAALHHCDRLRLAIKGRIPGRKKPAKTTVHSSAHLPPLASQRTERG